MHAKDSSDLADVLLFLPGSLQQLCSPCDPCLVPQFSLKFHYAKRRFPVISKYRQMYEVLNVDEIKN
jgi:hypothetical protein